MHAGLFSDVLNYVLRISKVATTTSCSETVSVDADGTKLKAKPLSVLRRKKVIFQGTEDDCTDVGMVCVQCFNFLKALAKDNREIQERYVYTT